MTLTFENIFSDFLGYITDYEMASLSMQDAYDNMVDLLNKAYKKPYVRSLFSSSSIDNEIQSLTFEMKVATSEDKDVDFICDVLAKGMVVEWLSPQVRSKLLTAQFFGGKEQKWFAQKNQLDGVRELYNETKREQRAMIGERNGIDNSYLGDES